MMKNTSMISTYRREKWRISVPNLYTQNKTKNIKKKKIKTKTYFWKKAIANQNKENKLIHSQITYNL